MPAPITTTTSITAEDEPSSSTSSGESEPTESAWWLNYLYRILGFMIGITASYLIYEAGRWLFGLAFNWCKGVDISVPLDTDLPPAIRGLPTGVWKSIKEQSPAFSPKQSIPAPLTELVKNW